MKIVKQDLIQFCQLSIKSIKGHLGDFLDLKVFLVTITLMFRVEQWRKDLHLFGEPALAPRVGGVAGGLSLIHI